MIAILSPRGSQVPKHKSMFSVPANATLKMLRCIFGSHIMQLAVAMSSMESENMDLCFGTCEILGLNIAITNLGYHLF